MKVGNVRIRARWLHYLLLFIGIVVLFYVVEGIGLQNKQIIQVVMKGCIFLSIVTLLFEKKGESMSAQLISIVVFIGLVMRIGYMLYTPSYVRGHDMWEISPESKGHYAYMLQVFLGKLPQSNEIQFYHPPFFYWLSSILMKGYGFLRGQVNLVELVEASKIVSCFASCMTLLLSKEICEELGLKVKSTLITLSVVAFLPSFYLLAGRANNDSLAVAFSIMAIGYTIKWYKNSTYKNSIGLALAFGLGMMTKMSVGVLAFFTGYLMLYKLFGKEYKTIRKEVFRQLTLFATICFPLALWFPIRNFILFKQPLNYVYDVGKNVNMNCSDYSLFERFLNFPLYELLEKNPYANPWQDCNTVMYLIKTAIFGEFTYMIEPLIAKGLLITTTALTLGVLGSGIWLLWKEKTMTKFMKWSLLGLIGVYYLSYIWFNMKYPYGCTMDFRYIVPLALVAGLVLGLTYEKVTHKIYRLFIGGNLIAFFAFSVSMYTSINLV